MAKPKVDEFVEVKKAHLDKLTQRLERLESAANKGRLARFDEINKDEIGKKVRLSKFKGKLVVGWSNMTINKCEKDPLSGVYVEDLRVNLKFSDDTDEEVNWTIWQKNREQVEAEVLSETKLKNGDIAVEVETKNGENLKINLKFVNS